jgi:NAD(P)-dependent dehydrogenase (short-subunit alcohol dehydrogenase family)
MTTSTIALITGGSRGLGRSAALQLAEKGSDVVITYHSNRKEADAVVALIEKAGRRAAALRLDTADVGGFDAFAAQLREVLQHRFKAGRFDFLVNNAGTSFNSSVVETTEAQFDEMVNVHFKGVFFLTQKLLPLIADGGRIVNLSSGLARFSMPNRSVYGAVKGAVEVLSRYLALELGPRRIAVNVVAPGAIATDFSGGIVRDNPQVNQHLASLTALGRVGQPDDVGGVIALLLQPGSGWINGQRIEVAGGVHL